MPEFSRDAEVAKQIKRLVAAARYRVRLHAVRHMIEEGFDERQLVEALGGRIRILEEYPDEKRYLVLGRFRFTPKAPCALHILCDLSNENVVDVVTAYVPQRPWWVSPTLRGRKK
jgi:hypothetical protein